MFITVAAIIRNAFFTVLSEFCMYSRIVQVGITTASDYFVQRDGIFHVRDQKGASHFVSFSIEEEKRHLLNHPSAEVIQSIFEQGLKMGFLIENIEVFSKTERRLYKRNNYTPLSVLSI